MGRGKSIFCWNQSSMESKFQRCIRQNGMIKYSYEILLSILSISIASTDVWLGWRYQMEAWLLFPGTKVPRSQGSRGAPERATKSVGGCVWNIFSINITSTVRLGGMRSHECETSWLSLWNQSSMELRFQRCLRQDDNDDEPSLELTKTTIRDQN